MPLASDKFKKFVKKESIEHVLVSVGILRANEQVERLNRVLMPMLVKLSDFPKKWDQIVEFAINNTFRNTRNTPSHLLFVVNKLGQINDHLHLVLEDHTTSERDILQLQEAASQGIIKNQSTNKRFYDQTHKKATTYKVDDYIVIM